MCQWSTTNNHTYNKWRTPRDLYPYCDANTCNHNTDLLTQYYTGRQHKHFVNIMNANFSTKQQRDTRYVTPTTTIPMAHIFINECNPENDIETYSDTIQTQFDVAHIYEDTGRHLITIPKMRLMETIPTCKKHHTQSRNLYPVIRNQNCMVISKIQIPKTIPLKRAQYTIPSPILDLLITMFNIYHSYFSSQVTSPRQFTQFYSPFSQGHNIWTTRENV